ncbi:MAG: bifunctional UDP-sugar hydrolase/5'-nucleotidase [Planctomycetota bacterium]|nr:bifunctional UDP-sugar hydrolase/5'-nucleotidase [Planctomycetota bacterium]
MRLSVAFLVLLAWAPTARGQESVRLTVLHTNDLHGQLKPLPDGTRARIGHGRGGFAHLASMVRAVRKEAQQPRTYVLLLDAGDQFQGTPLGNETHGDAVIDAMNTLGYDAGCVGNHELDFGVANLVRLSKRARFPLLAANMTRLKGDLGSVKPYVVLAPPQAPCRIALIGLITQSTPEQTSANVRGVLRFADPAQTARKLMSEVQADLYILVTHLGVEDDVRLLREVPEVALIVGGHSHTALPRGISEGERVRIVQTSGKGRTLGRVDLDLEPGTWKVLRAKARHLPVDPSAAEADAAVNAVIARHSQSLSEKLARVVGVLAEPLRRSGRTSSSSAGNFIADAMRNACRAEVAFMNKGGIRCDLPAGNVTGEDLYRMSPFDNWLVVLELRGKELHSLAEQSLNGRLPPLEWSGMDVDAERDGKRYRVVAVRVGKEPLDAERTYRVATHSFLARGGDGYAQFTRGKTLPAARVLLRDVLQAELARASPLTPPSEPRLRVLEPTGAGG